MTALSHADEDVLDELLLGLANGVALSDLPTGELIAIRHDLRELNAEALADKRADPMFSGTWHDVTNTALRKVNGEIARDRAYRRRQLALSLEHPAYA